MNPLSSLFTWWHRRRSLDSHQADICQASLAPDFAVRTLESFSEFWIAEGPLGVNELREAELFRSKELAVPSRTWNEAWICLIEAEVATYPQ